MSDLANEFREHAKFFNPASLTRVLFEQGANRLTRLEAVLEAARAYADHGYMGDDIPEHKWRALSEAILICDDGSRSHGPLRAKMPELVDELLGRAKVLEEAVRNQPCEELSLGGHSETCWRCQALQAVAREDCVK